MADTAAKSVVVGIDGSTAAINTAIWAVDEAVNRDISLWLVHVVHAKSGPTEAFHLEVQFAETSLRTADAVVNDIGRPVKVETDILRGPVDSALIDQSRNAVLLCVGSVGIGWVAGELLGSTAATLAKKANRPVAIIRSPRDKPASRADWIVVEWSMNEARLRQAPVLAVGAARKGFDDTPYHVLGQRMGIWKRQYRDVHVYPAITHAGIARFLAGNKNESVQLAVIGAADADQRASSVRITIPSSGTVNARFWLSGDDGRPCPEWVVASEAAGRIGRDASPERNQLRRNHWGPPEFWPGMSVIGKFGIGLGDGVFGSVGMSAGGISRMSLAGGPFSRPP